MKTKWEYYKINEEKIKDIQEKYNVNSLLATILANREIQDIKKYLEPTRHDFHNPYQMPDMEKAVERILKAIENKEKIIIFGDYDVDGITSITVLKSFFKDLGVEVDEYIPNRLNEGYGLNKEAIKIIAEQGHNLMITVDCGITGIEEIEYAKSLGIETIVTDHHEPGEKLPNAIAVVDCKRKDNKYPFRELAGVGVAFKLCQAISQKLNLDEKQYLKYLDIVALGTISDIVPLKDENRVITKLGLMLIKQTKNCGLISLLNLAGYRKIDSTAISFGVAPRINACGRMGHANEALDLLLCGNMREASEKARNIAKYNNDRQEYEKIIYEDAIKQIEKNHLEDENSIVLGGDDWHHGVVGIVASKITDLYYKPCLLVCYKDGEDIGKGSGRSIAGFDLHEALTECKDVLEGFGGHSMAVGLSIKRENLPKLKVKFEEYAKTADLKGIYPTINIDCNINIDNINKEIVESLSLLEPLGEGNKMPIFAFKNLKIDSIRSLTEGKHLRLILKSNNNTYINVIGFNLGYMVDDFVIGDKVDVVGCLEINSFNGTDSVQINLKDIMKSI
ncbi:MAG: single-stranded-DNA-specific exonuclease RecJ [Clostridia bacterium]|nr:single-stranded-DNA-specific exonuclease RecJ [Clostridia bacterium]